MKFVYIIKYFGQETDCSYDFGSTNIAYSKLEDAKRAMLYEIYEPFEDVFGLDCDAGEFDDAAVLENTIGSFSNDGMSWHLNREYNCYYSYTVEIQKLRLI